LIEYQQKPPLCLLLKTPFLLVCFDENFLRLNQTIVHMGTFSIQQASLLEERGFNAIPIASAVPVEMMDRGEVLGDISHRHAAVQAGLGRIGLSHNFLHPNSAPGSAWKAW
jgi:hypothetical protein